MKLLIDTNVIIDYTMRRNPFFKSAELLMKLGRIGEFDLFISSSQVTDIFYLLSKGGRSSACCKAIEAIKALRSFVGICAITELDIDKALATGWPDFEDACIYQAALKAEVDFIISRDKEGFLKSAIPVFDCDEFFEYLKRDKGVVYEEISF